MNRKTKIYLIHVVGLIIASLVIGGANFFDEVGPFLTRPAGFWVFLILGLCFLSGFFWLKDDGIGGNSNCDDDYEEQEYHHNKNDY